jgi:hypothetical protein
MADVETPIVTEESALKISKMGGAVAIMDRWLLAEDAETALKKLEIWKTILAQLRKHAIAETYPSDWVIHTTKDANGEVVKQVGYLQDSGCERAGKMFGIEVGVPTWQHEVMPLDSTFAYHVSAPAWSKITGEQIDRCEGSRWSGDKFFTSRLKEDDDKVDPTDVRKAAYANLHGRAVRALGGLSAVPLDTLKENGVDITKCLYVGYDKGAKGGESAGASVGSADVTVAFGRSAGKKVSELEDRDLTWYVKAYGENVTDPGKERYKKANQRVLDALKAEQEKRAQGAAHEEATGTKAAETTKAPDATPPATAPPAGEAAGEGPRTTRGEKLGVVWTLLQDAGGKNAIALLRQVTKDFGAERGAMSEVTDAELDKIIALGADNLKRTAAALAKAK